MTDRFRFSYVPGLVSPTFGCGKYLAERHRANNDANVAKIAAHMKKYDLPWTEDNVRCAVSDLWNELDILVQPQRKMPRTVEIPELQEMMTRLLHENPAIDDSTENGELIVREFLSSRTPPGRTYQAFHNAAARVVHKLKRYDPPPPPAPVYDEGELRPDQLPLEASATMLRHATKEQVRDVVARRHKRDEWLSKQD